MLETRVAPLLVPPGRSHIFPWNFFCSPKRPSFSSRGETDPFISRLDPRARERSAFEPRPLSLFIARRSARAFSFPLPARNLHIFWVTRLTESSQNPAVSEKFLENKNVPDPLLSFTDLIPRRGAPRFTPSFRCFRFPLRSLAYSLPPWRPHCIHVHVSTSVWSLPGLARIFSRSTDPRTRSALVTRGNHRATSVHRKTGKTRRKEEKRVRFYGSLPPRAAPGANVSAG